MSFYMRYELSRLIREEEAKTFAGIRRDTGDAVFLHLIAQGAAGIPAGLLELIGQAEAAGAILESGDFAGTRYLVTQPIEPFYGLRAWLQNIAEGSSSRNPLRPPTAERKPAAQPAPPPPPQAPPFRPPEASRPPVEPAAPPPRSRPEPPSLPSSTPSRPAGAGPSEFTLLFGDPRKKTQPAPESRTPGRTPPTDEFDSYFSGGNKGAPRGPVTPPAGKAGEFTSLFGKGESPLKPSSGGRPAPPPLPESHGPFDTSVPAPPTSLPSRTPPPLPSWRPQAPETGIGEFDKVFHPPAPPPKPEPPPPEDAEPMWPDFAASAPADKQEGESQFTRFFGSAIPGEEIDIAAEQARNAGVKDDAAPFQPAGGFTRVFGPDPGAKTPPPPPPPRPGKAGNMGASQMFSIDAPFMERAAAERPPEEPSAPNAGRGEPGEYTRMMALGGDAGTLPTGGIPIPSAPPPSRPAAPLSQVMPEIMTAQNRGRRILRTILIVLGILAGLALLFMIVFMLMRRFAASQ